MFKLIDVDGLNTFIKVVGVGGGGGAAVNHMVESHIEGVEFICANTDVEALEKTAARTKLQLGSNTTMGLGAGADPEVGLQAAEEDRDRIREALEGSDMVFIVAGMGGGTGTGAAPVVAEVARELGILTVAVVTKPFPFEGGKRKAVANKGIEELGKHVDSLITIPNEKLLSVLGKTTSLLDAFKAANDMLLNAVQGIAELITKPGLINVDFADVRTVMSEMGVAMMGIGKASGDDRAREAAEAAINSPLLEDADLSEAKGILVNITAGMDLSIGEFDEVGMTVKEFASDDATIVVGTVIDPGMREELGVTIVATGFRSEAEKSRLNRAQSGHGHPGRDNSNSENVAALASHQEEAPRIRGVKLVVDETTSDEEIAELIIHLSNVYKSIGGDELVVQGVSDVPPNSISRSATEVRKRRAAK